MQHGNVLALSERLCQPFFTIAFCLAPSLDGHVKSSQVMLKFKVDGPFCRRQVDDFNLLHRRNLVDFGDILDTASVYYVSLSAVLALPDERTGRGTFVRAHDAEHATPKCELHGTSGIFPRLSFDTIQQLANWKQQSPPRTGLLPSALLNLRRVAFSVVVDA